MRWRAWIAGLSDVLPGLPSLDVRDAGLVDAVVGCDVDLTPWVCSDCSYVILGELVGGVGFPEVLGRHDGCPVASGIGHVLCPSAPHEILHSVVCADTIEVATVEPITEPLEALKDEAMGLVWATVDVDHEVAVRVDLLLHLSPLVTQTPSAVLA